MLICNLVPICRATLAFLTASSFILGALCSGAAGYVGMWVSVRANVRVAGAARRSAREALQIALRAGGFSAMIVVGMVCCNKLSECYAMSATWFGTADARIA